jgi:IS5 family transposase
MKKKKTNQRSPKRRRPKKKRQVFRSHNWAKYNRSLIARGALTVWIDTEVLGHWGRCDHDGRRGAPRTYSDAVIMTALTLREVYHLPLRATKGMIGSVLQLMGLSHLPVPDYSTLCRRAQVLQVPLDAVIGMGAVHIVVDSTGCKVFCEGEWKVRQHGDSKRRTWRKLHLGVNEADGQIKAALFTTNSMSDGEALPELIEQVEEPIEQLSGDGSYDKRNCYRVLAKRQENQGRLVKAAIPPRHDARIERHGNCKGERLARDETIRRIRQVGRARWKEETGYHRRSLAETTMFRFKTIFGERLKARTFESQATEVFIRCNLLNRMNQMGRLESYLADAK